MHQDCSAGSQGVVLSVLMHTMFQSVAVSAAVDYNELYCIIVRRLIWKVKLQAHRPFFMTVKFAQVCVCET